MKKILILTTVGGFLSQFESGNVRILQAMGYQVHYASDFDCPVYSFDIQELKARGIIIHPIPIRKSPFALIKNHQAYKKVTRLIDEEEIGLVHCHNPVGGVIGRLAAKASGQKPYVIYTAHGFHFYQGASFLNWCISFPAEKALARETDRLITINQEDYERAQRTFKLKERGKVERIFGPGLDVSRFSPEPERRSEVRKALNIPPNAFHLVNAAEINKNKNQSILIDAICRLKDLGLMLTICGEGPLRKKLEKKVIRLGLKDQIRFSGYRSDMESVLQSADCFVFPSKREGLGMAALEALSCGIPVIAADNRGSREYMRPGVNGEIFAPDDICGVMNAICTIREADRNSRYLPKACRDSVRRFSAEENRALMAEIYQEADRENGS